MKLDHCVLPTADLAVARERLASLGFTVAPDAFHPFGTANCCVFFRDGTYLEPLANADEDAVRRASELGNSFVLRDRAFRETCGEEGFSAFALGTGDAVADHTRFVKTGISAGPPLSFSRPFTDATGNRAEASFKPAFAAPCSSPSFFFACERVNMPATGRFLPHHDNGVIGISRILATTAEPDASNEFFTRLLQKAPDEEGIWILSAEHQPIFQPNPHAALWLLAHADARRICRVEAGADNRLRLCGIVFRVKDVEALAERLVVAEIAHIMHRGKLMVPPAPGQGTVFIFEGPEESSLIGNALNFLFWMPLPHRA